jgi:hypothetical protein
MRLVWSCSDCKTSGVVDCPPPDPKKPTRTFKGVYSTLLSHVPDHEEEKLAISTCEFSWVDPMDPQSWEVIITVSVRHIHPVGKSGIVEERMYVNTAEWIGHPGDLSMVVSVTEEGKEFSYGDPLMDEWRRPGGYLLVKTSLREEGDNGLVREKGWEVFRT